MWSRVRGRVGAAVGARRTSFDGAVCVVTGAGSGLGAELVRQLVGRGAAHVYAADVNADALDAMVADVGPGGADGPGGAAGVPPGA